MKAARLAFAAAVLAAGASVPAPASGQSALSAPSRASTVRIAIPRGRTCFRHEGSATHLVGDFRQGQRIIATSTGDSANGDGSAEWETTQARNVSVSWGRADDEHGFQGGEPWTAPVTGRYTFSFSPVSMMGGRGVFMVCALRASTRSR